LAGRQQPGPGLLDLLALWEIPGQVKLILVASLMFPAAGQQAMGERRSAQPQSRVAPEFGLLNSVFCHRQTIVSKSS